MHTTGASACCGKIKTSEGYYVDVNQCHKCLHCDEIFATARQKTMHDLCKHTAITEYNNISVANVSEKESDTLVSEKESDSDSMTNDLSDEKHSVEDYFETIDRMQSIYPTR